MAHTHKPFASIYLRRLTSGRILPTTHTLSLYLPPSPSLPLALALAVSHSRALSLSRSPSLSLSLAARDVLGARMREPARERDYDDLLIEERERECKRARA